MSERQEERNLPPLTLADAAKFVDVALTIAARANAPPEVLDALLDAARLIVAQDSEGDTRPKPARTSKH